MRQSDPKFGENSPGLDHDPRAIRRRFVPGRRQAQDIPWVAGTQGANDHIVARRGIFDDDEIVTHFGDKANRLYCCCTVLQQRALEVLVEPGPGDRTGTDVRANTVFKVINDGVKRGRLDVPLFDKNSLQRANPKLHRIDGGIFVPVAMVVRMVVFV